MTDSIEPITEGKVIGEVVAVCVGEQKGEKKSIRNFITLKSGHGVQGDAHAGTEKEVSILSHHLVDTFIKKTGLDAPPGCFAENIRIRWLHPVEMKAGTCLAVGNAELSISSLGKPSTEKHRYTYKGYSLLAKKGIFSKVIRGGEIRPGDSVRITGWKQ
jgi:molybdopterin adenylyltransferase